MIQIAFFKYLRSVTLMKLVLAFCAIPLIGFVWFVLWFWASMKGEPRMADMVREARAIQSGAIKPDRSGHVSLAKDMVFVTRDANKALTILWPYNLAHDDNYFEGYLFSDPVLTSDRTVALAPDRQGYIGAPGFRMTHLKVDRKISEHWYHVQGEMHK